MALGLTQPLRGMSIKNISWEVKAAGAQGRQRYHLHVSIVLKSGSLNLLEPSGPVQACNGTALPLKFLLQPYHLHVSIFLKSGSLNLLEPSVPVQDCNGTALPLKFLLQPCHLHVSIFLKSGSLNLLEPSGPVQDCNGTALRLRLPLPLFYFLRSLAFIFNCCNKSLFLKKDHAEYSRYIFIRLFR